MKFKNEALWQEGLKNSQDDYGSAVYQYAQSWAEMMEKELEVGGKLEECAKRLSFEAVPQGITMFMYGCAVSILAGCWEYGEELRVWHNLASQIQHEGEKANRDGGVLNPALLTVE